MNERAFYDILIIALLRIPAPYGRHSRSGWGPTISDKLGWVVMEATALLIFVAFFMLGSTTTIPALVLLGLWCLHYIDRTFIYPFNLRSTSNRMPIIVMSAGLLFNAVNGYLNSRYIFTFSNGYTNEWLVDYRFIIGLSLFLTGFIINRSADTSQSAPPRRVRLQNPAPGFLSLDIITQLLRRDHHLDWMGGGDMVTGWSGICGMDGGKPGT